MKNLKLMTCPQGDVPCRYVPVIYWVGEVLGGKRQRGMCSICTEPGPKGRVPRIKFLRRRAQGCSKWRYIPC
jgi:hypothetical protein